MPCHPSRLSSDLLRIKVLTRVHTMVVCILGCGHNCFQDNLHKWCHIKGWDILQGLPWLLNIFQWDLEVIEARVDPASNRILLPCNVQALMLEWDLPMLLSEWLHTPTTIHTFSSNNIIQACIQECECNSLLLVVIQAFDVQVLPLATCTIISNIHK